MYLIVSIKCWAPPSGKSSLSTLVTTTCLSPNFKTDLATLRGSIGSGGSEGLPVFTLQNAHALVQVSPNIIKVACFFSQHSPIFGHAAS